LLKLFSQIKRMLVTTTNLINITLKIKMNYFKLGRLRKPLLHWGTTEIFLIWRTKKLTFKNGKTI